MGWTEGSSPDRTGTDVSPGLMNAVTLIVAGMVLGAGWREVLHLTLWLLAGFTPRG